MLHLDNREPHTVARRERSNELEQGNRWSGSVLKSKNIQHLRRSKQHHIVFIHELRARVTFQKLTTKAAQGGSTSKKPWFNNSNKQI